MGETAKIALVISVWMMIIWWITEAIPVYATALFPIGLIPLNFTSKNSPLIFNLKSIEII